MASDQRVVDYVIDQIRGAGEVRARKMFGEFAIYCDERVVALVADNQLYVRPTEAGRAFVSEVTEASPYPGAKPHFLVTERLDDREWLTELVVVTSREVPVPKPKKRAAAKAPTRGKAKATTKRTVKPRKKRR